MPTLELAKKKLDTVITKSRAHFYKPIQIAEILHWHRKKLHAFDLGDLDSYVNISKRWRDLVTQALVGRASTSSDKYQKDVFNEAACPPWAIKILGEFNESTGNEGAVEAYIYAKIRQKLLAISEAKDYLESQGSSFDLAEFMSRFVATPGLKRSMDKIYEVAAHALFCSIADLLKVRVQISYDKSKQDAAEDFEKFLDVVVGVDTQSGETTLPAKLFRVGVTNAADRGLDMFSNFGAAVQVKHLDLNEDLAQDIAGSITADRIVIVCRNADEKAMTAIKARPDLANRIQGFITFDDLKRWYDVLLKEKKYGSDAATSLMAHFLRDFQDEFPSTDNVLPFMKERGYDAVQMPAGWEK